jgi:uncharacterized protein (DUF1501 family)
MENRCPFDKDPDAPVAEPGISVKEPLDFLSRPVSRREFMKMAAMFWFSTMIPFKLFKRIAQAAEGPTVRGEWDRVLVLLELNGGNDGLNTVIPYTDPLYYESRKRIAIPRDQVAPLSHSLGLHPSLSPLLPMWQKHEMAVVLGVGYPKPNRSHFRSIAIWETASDSDQYLDEGWMARLFRESPPPDGFAADGIVLGNGQAGPLSGPQVRVVSMEKPEQFLNQSRGLPAEIQQNFTNPALEHILDVENDIRKAAAALGDRLRKAPLFQTSFPKSRIGSHLEVAAKLIAAGTPAPVLKLNHGSFDTHSGQKDRQARLLKELGEGLAAFQSALKEVGLWDKVMVMTYSEFGRRVRDNDSSGTDHGAAAPHFLMGGQVKGGFYGKQPSLTHLADGDLHYHVDYRSLYETVAARWWKLRPDFLPKRRYDILPCIR